MSVELPQAAEAKAKEEEAELKKVKAEEAKVSVSPVMWNSVIVPEDGGVANYAYVALLFNEGRCGC